MRGARCEVGRGTGVLGLQAVLLVVLLAGCAGMQAVATLDPALRLRERAGQYWDARVRGDLVETYNLHEPAFRRAVTLTAFAQSRGMTRVLEYEIRGERIEGDVGIVQMRMTAVATHPKLVKPAEPVQRDFEEQWVRVDGEWYRKYRFPFGRDPYPPVDWEKVGAGSQSFRPMPRR